MNKKFTLMQEASEIEIIEIRKCKYCLEEFPVTSIEKELLGKHMFKYPEHCSLCNFKLLNSFLNDKNLYHVKDNSDNKNIISIHSGETCVNIMEVNKYKRYILDDKWFDYAMDIWDDIFEDFRKIYKNFPRPSRLVYPSLENWEYSSHSWWAKNVYLSFCVFVDCEDIYHSFRIIGWCTNIFSSYNLTNCSNFYYSKNFWNSNNVFFSSSWYNCHDLIFCKDMINCKECIFSCNQVNKSYMVYNKQYTKQEYVEIKKDVLSRIQDRDWFDFLESKYKEMLETTLIREATDTNRCEYVSWENVYDSKKCFNSHCWSGLENCVNIQNLWDSSEDTCVNIINSIEAWSNIQNCFWMVSFWKNVYNSFYSISMTESKNIYYSIDLELCEECMFCMWLKSKKYCILNNQYDKKTYFEKKDEIISKLINDWKWWDHIWWDVQSFPYNDTLSYDYFWVNKIIYFDWREEILNKNSNWIVRLLWDDFISKAKLDLWSWEEIDIFWRIWEKEINIPDNFEKIHSSNLPKISDADESIIDKVIICEQTRRPFRIIKKELEFLKKKNMPLPRHHHNYRISNLIWTNPIGQLFLWKCDKCWSDMLIAFNKKPPCKAVYCSPCYKEYMYV